MKGFDWLKAIGFVGDDLIEEAEYTPRKESYWGRYLALAACACIVIGIGSMALRGGSKSDSEAPGAANGSAWGSSDSAGKTESAPGEPTGGEAADEAAAPGGMGPADPNSFLSYTGPVLPLTLAEQNDAVMAMRSMTFDFAPYESGNMASLVTDSYVLTNNSAEDVTVTALYPVITDFYDLCEQTPVLTVGGEPAAAELVVGGYAGGFIDFDGSTGGARWNSDPFNSWEEYAELLADGSYLADAFSTDNAALDQTVTVYRFTDTEGPTEQHQAATLALWSTIDETKTTVLTYGFNGGGWDPNTGEREFSYFIRHNEGVKLLVVLGEDLGEYRLQGYQNGNCSAGNELDGVTATVTREQMTIRELIGIIAADYTVRTGGTFSWNDAYFEPFCGALSDALFAFGALSETPAERYSLDSRLDDFVMDVYAFERVMYLSCEVTIPAGSAVELTAKLERSGSHNYFCGAPSAVGEGYDLLTQTGSNLAFGSQTVQISNGSAVDILDQNLPADGALDLNEPHYFLIVSS